jgi:hypothetical protein
MSAVARRNRTLVIGAGSGRDIASAMLAVGMHRERFGSIDLAGFLTPWAWHSFDDQPERPINQLRGRAVKFLAGQPDRPLTSFFEPSLPAVFADRGIEVDDIYLFSLQYGTAALERPFRELVSTGGYDRIVAVDIGGDILARRQEFGRVLTPLIDFSCLELLTALSSSVSVELVVVAPGVCGEVASDALTQIFETLAHGGAVTSVEHYTADTPAYREFVAVNQELERLTTARSHTFRVVTELAARAPQQDAYDKEFVRRYQIGDTAFDVTFPVSIAPRLHNQIWHLDPARVHRLLARPALHFRTLLDALAVAKNASLCGTEIDCTLVTADAATAGRGPTVFLLTPCCYAQGRLRRAIIAAGIETWALRRAVPVVLLAHDAEDADLRGLRTWRAGQFTIAVSPAGARFAEAAYQALSAAASALAQP